MRNDDILFIVNSYNALKGKESSVVLPAAVAWKRRLNIKELVKASEIIDEALKELSAKYEDDLHSEVKEITNPDGSKHEARIVKPEFISKYLADQKEILMQDTDVTIRKIKIEDLEGVSISDEWLDTIDFMIEE